MSKFEFQPDYENIVKTAYNIEAPRLPLYEHIISVGHLELIAGEKFGHLGGGNYADKVEFFRNFCNSAKAVGYDTISYEWCISSVMPNNGCLGGHRESVIKTREDFEKYPWDEIPNTFFRVFANDFKALAEAMPDGMKAVGGVGNGVFECVQDVIGYINLCYIANDDPELYADLFKRIGDISCIIWDRFMRECAEPFCVMRFGDDLGFKSTTLISAEDIKAHVIPQYKKIVDIVHSHNKPFMLHSCGAIFNVMDDMINVAHINAKHSNEDQIAPFPEWVRLYGDKIGNFGGIDTDAVCRLDRAEMKEYITDVVAKCTNRGGFAFGSGNSIPDYVPHENFINMTEIIREIRGER